MLIANPIYDSMFKRMMDDDDIARYLIETIMGETIIALTVKQQEYTTPPKVKDQAYYDEAFSRLAVYRLDYVALVRTRDGADKKVLIEVQKARADTDLMRFRNYLGEQYKREDEVETAYGKQWRALPIVTIYLLGFKLENLPFSAIRVGGCYVDMHTQQPVKERSQFIEQLNHTSYVVQIPRIEPDMQSRLDELLSVFEQRNFVPGNKWIREYNYPVQSQGGQKLVALLQKEAADPVLRKEIEDEIEFWRSFEGGSKNKFDKLRRDIEERDKALEENAKALEENVKALEENAKALEANEQALNEKDKALSEKETALADKEREIEELKKLLNRNNS